MVLPTISARPISSQVDSVVIAGSIAQAAFRPGHAHVFLNYALGFKGLGYDVLLVDHLSNEMISNVPGLTPSRARKRAVEWFKIVTRYGGLEDSATLLFDNGTSVGLSRRALQSRIATSVLMLNFMGFITDAALLEAAPRRVFVDIDPGFPQMWDELGWYDAFTDHDAFVTLGENVGSADCLIPTRSLPWITTRQPVVLDRWPTVPGGDKFTSVATWRGPFDAVYFRNERFGLRVHEFRRFMELPKRTSVEFELALDIDPEDSSDLEALRTSGWRLTLPSTIGDFGSYRRFIQRSLGEFMVAKGMYVSTNSGWFSDRSISYLASGKPVVAEETGFSAYYPVGEGLLPFSTLDEALAAVEAVRARPTLHARAARGLAEELFDAKHVLERLLQRLNPS
jgi:hypothetical protein